MASSSFWKLRPSAVTSAVSAYEFDSSRRALEDFYEADNRTADARGIRVLPRRESARLRTLQWNVDNASYESSGRAWPSGAVRGGLIDAIRDADADVLVLNEYCRAICPDEGGLRDLGYSHLQRASVSYGTTLATRLEVTEHREIVLSGDRTALLARVCPEDGEPVWVIGTHLNHCFGRQRNMEMQVLLDELNEMGIIGDGATNAIDRTKERIVLLGDFNQQRECDYTRDEWDRIKSGMRRRGSCVDDGVAGMLKEQGFTCAWDNSNPAPRINWETPHPPATHWSGTIVDYSYGRNVSSMAVSIGPTGWSDHRMTVCDWTWR